MDKQQSGQLALLQSGQLVESNPNQQFQAQAPQGQVFYPGELDETEGKFTLDVKSLGAKSMASENPVEQKPMQSGFARSDNSMSMLFTQKLSTVKLAAQTWAELDNVKNQLTTHEIVAKLQEKSHFDKQQELRMQEHLKQVVRDALGGPVRETEQLPSGTTLSLQRSLIAPHPKDHAEVVPVARIRGRPRLYELQNMLRSQFRHPVTPASQADSRASSRRGSKAQSISSELTSISRQWRPEPLGDFNGRSDSKPSSTTRSATTLPSRWSSVTASTSGALMSASWSGGKRWNAKDQNIMKRCSSTPTTYRVA
eukprot:TRINITY_DN10911_c0_g1_i1.p1 TRINITY_DN10911_c0_g1~~TRINITY_DN10911_c0_g1_i1.p1  ORF type:complete len:311 (-),score=49.05 TRINITY_DN10911_c0_g1_i1:659-1591(-)